MFIKTIMNDQHMQVLSKCKIPIVHFRPNVMVFKAKVVATNLSRKMLGNLVTNNLSPDTVLLVFKLVQTNWIPRKA